MTASNTFNRAHRWCAGASFAAAAAAMIGMGTAHADTPDDVIDQAISDLSQSDAVLDAAPTADLSTQAAGFLASQATLGTQLDPLLSQIASGQEGLSAADQAFLAAADEQFVSAAQNVLSADQAFVAADQAGDLSGSTFNATDLTVIDADLGLVGADFNVLGDTLLVAFDPDIGTLLP